MEQWTGILKVVAGKLTAGLAFAILMLIVVAQFGDQIPERYKNLPYFLIVLAYLVLLSLKSQKHVKKLLGM